MARPRSQPKQATSVPPRLRPTRPKLSACHACHSRKVKCSGGDPCSNCRKRTTKCSYPTSNRLIRVPESYLKDILRQNTSSQSSGSSSPQSPSNGKADSSVTVVPSTAPHNLASDGIDPHISLDVESLFIDVDLPYMPVPVNEAMDTAFATRFRQVIIMNLAEATCPWPSPPKARLLIEVALRVVSGCFHIVRKSCVLDAVEMSHSTSSSNQIPTWKEYSVKYHDFPGLHYFAKATKILNYLGERPTMDLLETRLILSLYSLAVNRQYAAYTLVGSSVRMAIIMGLHISITPDQLDDAAVREHRTRLWWTAHVMDCLFSSRLGHRPTVHEDDIKASLPREIEAAEATSADFSDASYFTANAKLSVIMTRIICSVYGSPTGSGNLSERVKQALDDLSLWTRDLPPELHSENTTTSKRCNLGLVYLRLTLNQAVILSTRPILLYGLRNIWTTAKPSTGPHGV
ncbi:putative transcriptional regulatory protein [Colletotrichum orbiculare MAFF 240422]|uniref:Transcriptional regulatory protein n=1 Tax=Colletotrichum orbiculare (strain 104-T / ATCC 96160 / CBS 514.97 / LARS 414 / MAFF 240422) TaxID=1213857 RepID=A0A484FDA7_COLOR|nr:putative transcriptional regulatory protein [Colletotrichum orbiculare MAFF 240422]